MRTISCSHCGGLMEVTGLPSSVQEFHEKFEINYDGPPRALPTADDKFRVKALREELKEYEDADTLEQKFDALIDLVYFALGAAHLHGFDFKAGWDRVHAANMAKVLSSVENPSKRGPEFNGMDIVKPKGWVAPDLRDLVGEAGDE